MVPVETHVTMPLCLPRHSQGPSLLESLRGVGEELTLVARNWKTHDSSATCWKAPKQMLSKKSYVWECCKSNISGCWFLPIMKASTELLQPS